MRRKFIIPEEVVSLSSVFCMDVVDVVHVVRDLIGDSNGDGYKNGRALTNRE